MSNHRKDIYINKLNLLEAMTTLPKRRECKAYFSQNVKIQAQAKEYSNKLKRNQKSRMVSQNAKEENQSINHQSIFNTMLNQATHQKGECNIQ